MKIHAYMIIHFIHWTALVEKDYLKFTVKDIVQLYFVEGSQFSQQRTSRTLVKKTKGYNQLQKNPLWKHNGLFITCAIEQLDLHRNTWPGSTLMGINAWPMADVLVLYLMIWHVRTVGTNASWYDSLVDNSYLPKDSDQWLYVGTFRSSTQLTLRPWKCQTSTQ